MPKFDKNATYKTRELADALMLNYPGRFKTINSCMTNIAKSIKRLGLEPSNKQKRCRVFAGKDAQAIYDDMVSIARGTPIEKAVKIAERELTLDEVVLAKEAEKATPTETVVDTMTAPKSITISTDENGKGTIELTENMTGLVIGPDGGVRPVCDAFATHRKQFYTDARYFLKDAQSPEERVAIWDALAELYGYKNITRQFFEEG